MSEANEVDGFVMRCYTCKYWNGDKAKAEKMAKENPISMDFDSGWPESATCKISHRSININDSGDGWANIDFDANFGCVHWCA